MSNTVIIAQSGTVYDSMLHQMNEDTKTILAQNKEICRLKVDLLKGSLAYEGARKHIKELESEVSRQHTVITRLKDVAVQHCECFENIFDSNEAILSYEQMENYLDIARYLQDKFNRRTIYIWLVEQKMKSLPS